MSMFFVCLFVFLNTYMYIWEVCSVFRALKRNDTYMPLAQIKLRTFIDSTDSTSLQMLVQHTQGACCRTKSNYILSQRTKAILTTTEIQPWCLNSHILLRQCSSVFGENCTQLLVVTAAGKLHSYFCHPAKRFVFWNCHNIDSCGPACL